MLTLGQKRLILIIIALIVSAIVWYINASWFNTFLTCLILSTTTFLIIYTPFEIYWSFRDIYFDRWEALSSDVIEKSRVKISVKDGSLIADLVKNKNPDLSLSKNSIIIICHGFSDIKETLQYLYYPLAQIGYTVLTYDARGSGESKDTGERNQFIERINDFGSIVEWIKNNDDLKTMKIHTMGISIGAITAISGGFDNKNIDKIIAVSAMSNYRQNVMNASSIVKFSYNIKGVKLYPDEDSNRRLSPFFIFKDLKDKLLEEEWKKYSKRVFLIHSKNDNIIKYNNFKENSSILELPERNHVVFKKGGHMMKKNELALMGATLNILNS